MQMVDEDPYKLPTIDESKWFIGGHLGSQIQSCNWQVRPPVMLWVWVACGGLAGSGRQRAEPRGRAAARGGFCFARPTCLIPARPPARLPTLPTARSSTAPPPPTTTTCCAASCTASSASLSSCLRPKTCCATPPPSRRWPSSPRAPATRTRTSRRGLFYFIAFWGVELCAPVMSQGLPCAHLHHPHRRRAGRALQARDHGREQHGPVVEPAGAARVQARRLLLRQGACGGVRAGWGRGGLGRRAARCMQQEPVCSGCPAARHLHAAH